MLDDESHKKIVAVGCHCSDAALQFYWLVLTQALKPIAFFTPYRYFVDDVLALVDT
jgi:hypothetical protein